MHGQCGQAPPSKAEFDASHALQPNKSITMSQGDCPALRNLYQWGRLCYDHHWWNLTRETAYNSYRILFRERTDGARPVLLAQIMPTASLVDMPRTDGCG